MKASFDLGAPARVLFFALLPAAAIAGGLALAVLIALAGAASLRPSLLRKAFENKPLFVLVLLAFVVWSAASSLWSPHPDHIQAPKLVLTVLLGLMFASASAASPAARRMTRTAAVAAFIVLSVLLAVEAAWNLPLNRAAQPQLVDWDLERNPARGVVILLGLTWALAAGALADERPRLALAAFAVSGLFAAQFHQFANIIAFGLGLGGFALAMMAPRFALLLASAGLALWMLAAPFVTPLVFADQSFVDTLPNSWAMREGIWSYVCERIAEQPWIGHGLDASRAVSDIIVVRGEEIRGVPLHPHSASLHIWFETGAVGAVLAAAAIMRGGWTLSRVFAQNRPAAAAACATLVAYGFIANVSFGIWQEWWNATMLLGAGMVAAFAPQADYLASPRRGAPRATPSVKAARA